MSSSHISQLNEQFAILQANVEEFGGIIDDIVLQYKAIQDLGMLHGSLFMASQTVYDDEYNPDKKKEM